MAKKTSAKHRFSIYLLKKGCKPEKAIKSGRLAKRKSSPLPKGSLLHFSSHQSDLPWWVKYLKLSVKPSRANSALAFITTGRRCFALAFGYARSNLEEAYCESDFGFRVALNSVDPDKLRACDILVPGTALRMKAQAPNYTSLGFFGLDQEDHIWSAFAGLVKEEHSKLFSRISSGRNCLRCTTDIKAEELNKLLKTLLKCYESKDYRKSFPNMDKIRPVLPSSNKEKLLCEKLEVALGEESDEVMLTIPEIVDDDRFEKACLNGERDMAKDDVSIDLYYEYVNKYSEHQFKAGQHNLQSLWLLDSEGKQCRKYSLYECFVFEATLEKETFILNEGKWYRVDKGLVSKVSKLLKEHHKKIVNLPCYKGPERKYNKKAAKECGYLCLDQKNILKSSWDRLEPCDLFTETSRRTPTLVHVKNPQSARDYSHLFNQGINSARTILFEESSLEKMNTLIEKSYNKIDRDKGLRVVYAIAVSNNERREGLPIPFFSQLSLYTILREYGINKVDVYFQFIEKKK